jgi:DNA-binding MarR family transcriptional regulator
MVKRCKRYEPDLVIPSEVLALAEHARAIDRVVHKPSRLTILALLIGNEISFREMQAKSGLTSGTLSVQTTNLEQAGYVEVLKTFRGRRPHTSFRLTPAGQAAWDTYWVHMNVLLHAIEENGTLEQPHGPGDHQAAIQT